MNFHNIKTIMLSTFYLLLAYYTKINKESNAFSFEFPIFYLFSKVLMSKAPSFKIAWDIVIAMQGN